MWRSRGAAVSAERGGCHCQSEAAGVFLSVQRALRGDGGVEDYTAAFYEKFCIDAEEAFAFLEFVAFATVGDVMELTDENRILVREGLKRLHRTANLGMRALILQNQLTPEQITSYHIGFVLGPCVNASGRLETAKIALNLFLQKNETDAGKIAKELVELNAQRKSMTADGVELAKQIVDEGTAGEKVLVIYLPGVHESLAGIIAGESGSPTTSRYLF